jgi:hypothetical protein
MREWKEGLNCNKTEETDPAPRKSTLQGER